MNEIIVEEKKRAVHDRSALIDRDEHPEKERFERETSSFGEFLVQFGIEQGDFRTHVFIEDEREHGKHRVDRAVANQEKALIERDRSEVEDRREDGLHDTNDQTTMHDELR